MNDPTTTQQTEFIWRRLADALHLGGREIDGHYWLLVLIPVLLLSALPTPSGNMSAIAGASAGRGRR